MCSHFHPHAHTHTRTHAHAHARTRTRTHTHARTETHADTHTHTQNEQTEVFGCSTGMSGCSAKRASYKPSTESQPTLCLCFKAYTDTYEVCVNIEWCKYEVFYHLQSVM